MPTKPEPIRPSSARPRGSGMDDLDSHHALLQGLSAPPGENFFKTLTRSLAVALNTVCGFVTEVAEEPGSLKILAIWTGDRFGENFTYQMRGTPSERILGQSLVTVEKGVQKAYPEYAWLAEVGAESYMAVPLLGSDGNALGHIGVVHDAPIEASEEKVAVLRAFATRAAGELERVAEHAASERVMGAVSALVQELPVGVLRVDRDGKIAFASRKLETMFGYERNELLGQPVERLVPANMRRSHAKRQKLFIRDPDYRPMDARLDLVGRRKDGSTFPVGIALSGDGSGATAVIRDTTTAREEADQMAQEQARLEAVVQAFPEMTFIIDRNGVYRDYETANGLEPYVPPEAFLGKALDEVLPEDVARMALGCVRRTLKTRKIHSLTYELEMPDAVHSYQARFVRLDKDRVAVFIRDHTAEAWLVDDGIGPTAKPEAGEKVEPIKEWQNAYGLSYREFSILHLLKDGTTDKEIAQSLGISVFTVNKHVSNILLKMDAASRTEAAIRALQEGLIN